MYIVRAKERKISMKTSGRQIIPKAEKLYEDLSSSIRTQNAVPILVMQQEEKIVLEIHRYKGIRIKASDLNSMKQKMGILYLWILLYEKYQGPKPFEIIELDNMPAFAKAIPNQAKDLLEDILDLNRDNFKLRFYEMIQQQKDDVINKQ